jgi:hypothetical protein
MSTQQDYGISINKSCTCSQKECPIRENCVLCIQNHIEHKRHMPECMQNLIREDIANLSKMVEYNSEEKRPNDQFWKDYDKTNLVKTSLAKHKCKK